MRTIASLTEEGWVQNSKDILGYIINYYILTDEAQSLAYQGNLISLAATYYKHINDPIVMADKVKSDLDKLLSRYFPTTTVETESKKITEKKYAILLYVSVIDDDGKRSELSKVVELDTSGIKKIIKVNNYGSGRDYLSNL
jgi:hypothetical protein